MKSGAEELVAGVRVDEADLVVLDPFPGLLPFGACFGFVAAFFFDILDACILADASLSGTFLVLAMA